MGCIRLEQMTEYLLEPLRRSRGRGFWGCQDGGLPSFFFFWEASECWWFVSLKILKVWMMGMKNWRSDNTPEKPEKDEETQRDEFVGSKGCHDLCLLIDRPIQNAVLIVTLSTFMIFVSVLVFPGVGSVGFSGTPNNGTPFWEASHTTPIRIPKDMGMVWE